MIHRFYRLLAIMVGVGVVIPLYSMNKISKVKKRFYSGYLEGGSRDGIINHLTKTLNPAIEERYKKDYYDKNYVGIESYKEIPHYASGPLRHINDIKGEFVRYAYLAKHLEREYVKKLPLGMFSKDVDNFWHTFLLFNKEYENFCKQLPQKSIASKAIDSIWYGKSYSSLLYHNPFPQGQGCPQVCQHDAKEYFKKTYRDLYRVFPPQDIWTGLKTCVSCEALEAIRHLGVRIKQEGSSTKQNKNKDSSSSAGGSTDMATGFIIGSTWGSSNSSSSSASTCSSCSSSSSSSSSSSDSGSSCSSCGGD